MVGTKQFVEVTKPNEIVNLLLNDDEISDLQKQAPDVLAQVMDAPVASSKKKGKRPVTDAPTRDLWNDEGDDDFFGHSALIQDVDDEAIPVAPPPVATPVAKRPRKSTGAKRTPKKKPANNEVQPPETA